MKSRIRIGNLFFFICVFLLTFRVQAAFRVTTLDVANGLSVLIEADGHFILYDGGGPETASYVVSYLKHQGVSKLDLMICSHFDSDHMAGLIGCMNAFPVEMIFRPDYEVDSDGYRTFVRTEERKGIQMLTPKAGEVYRFSDAGLKLQILGPVGDADCENCRSLVCRFIYRDEVSAFIGGDCEKEQELQIANLLPLESEIYVANHHGSNTSSSEELLSALRPAAALISCGKDNTYGHPDREVLERLNAAGCRVFRTDRMGEVRISYDNGTLYAERVPYAGEEELPASETAEGSLVLNMKTGIFHKPSCTWAKKISVYNSLTVSEEREELILEGYKPCGSCRP